MKDEMNTTSDADLQRLIREVRPASALPAGFKAAVWRRLDSLPVPWADRIVEWFFRPRLVAAGVVAVVLLGIGMGVFDARLNSKQMAQERYITSISPWRGE